MPLEQFWDNIKFAERERAIGAAPVLQPPYGQSSRVVDVALWVQPATVEGFDPADFPFLAPPDRNKLVQAVAAFRRATASVDMDGPVTRQQQAEAGEALDEISKLLDTKRHASAEDYRLDAILQRCGKELERQSLPVRGLTGRIEPDSTGDMAAWIRVITDDRLEGKDLFELQEQIRLFLERRLEVYGMRFWPYIIFGVDRNGEAIAQGSVAR